jgi:hypothetical protein
MLGLGSFHERNCERQTRRDFLRVGALTGFGLSLPMLLAGRQAAARQGLPARDVNCILIWTRGGTSHHDTFDPKPDAPDSVRGEFGVIDTTVPGSAWPCSASARWRSRGSRLIPPAAVVGKLPATECPAQGWAEAPEAVRPVECWR